MAVDGRHRPRARQPTAAKKVLLLKAGEAAGPVRVSASGDYDQWFFRAVGHELAKFTVLRPYAGEPLPRSAEGFDQVWMTGSPLSVREPLPWMDAAGAFLVESAERGTPVLGVCFGHQLLARTLGAQIVKNPRGREIGTVEIGLTPEGERDPLFEGVGARFFAQATHEDIVEQLPEGTTALAGNANTPLQAIAFGPSARGVQFHPEMDTAATVQVLKARAPQVEREGAAALEPDRLRRIEAAVRPSPHAVRVLANFLRHF